MHIRDPIPSPLSAVGLLPISRSHQNSWSLMNWRNSTLQYSMISADILIAEVLTGLQIFAVDFYPEGVGIFAGTGPLLLRVYHFWVHLCIHSKFLHLPRVVGVRESMSLLVIISADLTPFLPCLPFSFFSFPSRTTGSIIFLMAEALGEQ